ncbi:ATP synthase subunit delta [Kurthia zopfii]|uniref:ATP synthase subunit delta n=1 Tax=Kurthia zopfii TaxID=1650 RepID=A0A2U3A979_9BACL|nr:F0F1 ATP synthase subunit delta [Kurthia zopfii]PWI21102.1 F0F1 ATP synthase subunit delta [Kurthia zopfii]TDR32284.1 ATP synthase F1 subcomplex delta subunit [Kurthia zopfii]STX08696.1 F-type ATPase subunit delta [Kurthia zopfii]VEI05088.1 F-type ATPase subunit delta [Kurthia zopfii]GEK32325.1 ATP synthase subunit delta [Kurthia zopfii]
MSQTIAANRYAKALFELAKEKNVVSETVADLRQAKIVFTESKDLFNLLENPKFSADKKNELVSTIFADAQPIVVDALKVLLDKKRINEAVSVFEAFIRIANDAAGIEDAIVLSTETLTEEQIQRISSTFAKKVGKNSLNITNEIDPSLIGGIKLIIGNQIYDNSIVSKMNGLRRELLG